MKNNVKSKIASDIIYAFELLPQLPYKDRYRLLDSLNYSMLKQLLRLIFTKSIIRHLDFSKTKISKTKIINADKRLHEFIENHNNFYQGKISTKIFYKNILTLFKKLHIKEYNFYKKLTEGNLLCLDYFEVKKHFFPDEKFIKTYARFCSGFTYQKNWEIDFPVYAQPLRPGLQIKVIATKNKVKVYSRNQTEFSGKMKHLEKAVFHYLNERTFNKVEVDVMVYALNYEEFTLNKNLNENKFDELQYHIYDVVVDSNVKKETLKRRLARVKTIVKFLKNSGYYFNTKGIEIKNAVQLSKIIKTYNNIHNCKGTILKNKFSIYQKSRTDDWVKIYGPNQHENLCLKQVTYKINSFSKEIEIDKLIGETSSGLLLPIEVYGSRATFLKDKISNLFGSYFSVCVKHDTLSLDKFSIHRNRF